MDMFPIWWLLQAQDKPGPVDLVPPVKEKVFDESRVVGISSYSHCFLLFLFFFLF